MVSKSSAPWHGVHPVLSCMLLRGGPQAACLCIKKLLWLQGQPSLWT